MTEFKKSADGEMQYSKEELARQGIPPEEVLGAATPSREILKGRFFVIDDAKRRERKMITEKQVKEIIGEMSVNNENTIFSHTKEETKQGEFFLQVGGLFDVISYYWNKFLKEGEYRYLEELKSKKNDLKSLCLKDELKQYSLLSEELEKIYPFLFDEDEESFRGFSKIKDKLWVYLGGSLKREREDSFVIDEKEINLKYLMHECFSAIEGRVTSVINPN